MYGGETEGWIEVGKDEFYRTIGPQNVSPYLRGRYPYVSLFRETNGTVRGKVVPDNHNQNRYYLPAPR